MTWKFLSCMLECSVCIAQPSKYFFIWQAQLHQTNHWLVPETYLLLPKCHSHILCLFSVHVMLYCCRESRLIAWAAIHHLCLDCSRGRLQTTNQKYWQAVNKWVSFMYCHCIWIYIIQLSQIGQNSLNTIGLSIPNSSGVQNLSRAIKRHCLIPLH